MWGPAEPTMWHEFQYLAAQGYAVVFANPRGSGGYGNRFRRLNAQDWGPGPAGDVLAAADAAAERSWIDASQQVVTGGSYGGYLTAWIVSQTDRFDAAVTQRGVYDLPTFFGEGNAWRLVPEHFGGYPWDGPLPPPAGTPDSLAASARNASGTPGSESSATGRADGAQADAFSASAVAPADTLLSPRDALIRNSPMTYAHQIRTPLLILHGSRDFRTGVSQSERLYRTLKVLERPVEYVRYPDAGHDLSRSGAPIQRLDRVLRIHEFLARYVDLPSGSPDDSRSASRP
jgi:dipeptidyl aminopeptidase/acylaminoacyl peptidase